MSAPITLSDGRSWWWSNGQYDVAIELIADVLDDDAPSRELAAWLLDQRCTIQGPGVGSLDIRELTVENQRRFNDAIPRVYARAVARGSADWLESLCFFVDMVAAVGRGEPIAIMPPIPPTSSQPVQILPPTGRCVGPGW